MNPVHAGKYSAVVNDEAVNAIWGSCVFSNPNADEGDAILLATSGSVRKVLMREPGVNTVIPFTAGVGGLNEPVEMLRAFDRVMLFRRGERVLEYRPIDSWVLRHYETNEIAEGWVALGDDDDGEWVFGDGVSSVECVNAGKLYYAKAVAGEFGDFRSMDGRIVTGKQIRRAHV